MNKSNHDQRSGAVLWLTGLSGAGKTTIAKQVYAFLSSGGYHPLMLDGDEVRDAIRDPHWGFDNQSRLNGSYRYARLASLIAKQGHVVIIPTISMFEEVRSWNREHTPGYYEVYLRTEETTRKARDPKQLYDERVEDRRFMAGLDLSVELPSNPDLVVDNNGGEESIVAVSDLIFRNFVEHLQSVGC
ncbi:adenylyl-sulfate kinase [Pseudoalteromonas sp. OOF1S-7]|uniref:adenylyl-sulfate kinase n=1 Tax=Pseudoalteromonas sp. OOF1S-7 TaxID=2917757 RepID=UPI001EF4C58C|nr:adenylyl-sulfate kinase [Pseudoalteromonas sp. OOF1S-7]MCG7537132.1 adenylyl-sulfate kinase [Pseudoalteromonas sp. OOF1S-7]